MAKVSKADWLYLSIGLLSTWWLTKLQMGKDPELEFLTACLKLVRRAERYLRELDTTLTDAIDRELDNYGN